MSSRSRFSAWGTCASLLVIPAIMRAQALPSVTVQYENARLSSVAASFSTFAGRAITLDPVIGDPFISASVRNGEWETGLDQILATQALIARPVSGGGFHIERERRISVDYQNAHLGQVVAAIAAFSGRRIEVPANASDVEVSAVIQDVDWQRALNQLLAQAGLVSRTDADGVVRGVPRSAQ